MLAMETKYSLQLFGSTLNSNNKNIHIMNTYKFIVNTLSKRGYLTLLALLITITTFGQEITVNGVVIDETETPLIGATVQVKNTQKEL